MRNKLSKLQTTSSPGVGLGDFHQAFWHPKVAAITLTFLATILGACSVNNPEQVGGPTARTNVTTEEVAERTNALIGQTVTVRNEVDKKVGAHSFTIGDEKLFGTEKILVINASGEPATLPDDIELQVTGKVAKLVVADLEREFNLDLEPELEAEYRDRPVIIAQSIALAPKPGEVTKNPSAYYNKVIAVQAEVENIISPISFTLDEDKLTSTQDLLVLNRTTYPAINDGQEVVVTGVLRPFVVADIERDYDLNWDLTLQRQLEAEYRQKPVLIAQNVYQSAQD